MGGGEVGAMWESPPRGKAKSKNNDLCLQLPRTVQTLESTGCSICAGRLLLISLRLMYLLTPLRDTKLRSRKKHRVKGEPIRCFFDL